MKEKASAVMIASFIAFVSLPGTSAAPAVQASPAVPALEERAQAPDPIRGYGGALPVAAPAGSPQKVVGDDGRESLGVKTTAPRVYAVDERSGAELYGTAEDEQVPLASITKLMTARVVRSKGLDWNKVVTMEKVVPDGGVPYFADGDQVTVRDLWKTMIVGSSNTAALALAKATGLSAEEFAAEMNAAAAGLGMRSTHFVEPTGLDEKNVSTARDIAVLARAAFADSSVTDASALPYFDLVKTVGSPKRVTATDRLIGSFLNKSPDRKSVV